LINDSYFKFSSSENFTPLLSHKRVIYRQLEIMKTNFSDDVDNYWRYACWHQKGNSEIAD